MTSTRRVPGAVSRFGGRRQEAEEVRPLVHARPGAHRAENAEPRQQRDERPLLHRFLRATNRPVSATRKVAAASLRWQCVSTGGLRSPSARSAPTPGLRLLLRHAVDRAEAGDQLGARNSDDLAVRDRLAQDRERAGVAGAAEDRDQHDAVRDVEVRVARRAAVARDLEARRHRQLDHRERVGRARRAPRAAGAGSRRAARGSGRSRSSQLAATTTPGATKRAMSSTWPSVSSPSMPSPSQITCFARQEFGEQPLHRVARAAAAAVRIEQARLGGEHGAERRRRRCRRPRAPCRRRKRGRPRIFSTCTRHGVVHLPAGILPAPVVEAEIAERRAIRPASPRRSGRDRDTRRPSSDSGGSARCDPDRRRPRGSPRARCPPSLRRRRRSRRLRAARARARMPRRSRAPPAARRARSRGCAATRARSRGGGSHSAGQR